MNNESVALTQVEIMNALTLGVPLYTNPVTELNDGGEPVKNATYWKRQYNLMATQNDNLKSGLYHANNQIKYLESQIKDLRKNLDVALMIVNKSELEWAIDFEASRKAQE